MISLHLYLTLSFTFNGQYLLNVVAPFSFNTCMVCDEWFSCHKIRINNDNLSSIWSCFPSFLISIALLCYHSPPCPNFRVIGGVGLCLSLFMRVLGSIAYVFCSACTLSAQSSVHCHVSTCAVFTVCGFVHLHR